MMASQCWYRLSNDIPWTVGMLLPQGHLKIMIITSLGSHTPPHQDYLIITSSPRSPLYLFSNTSRSYFCCLPFMPNASGHLTHTHTDTLGTDLGLGVNHGERTTTEMWAWMQAKEWTWRWFWMWTWKRRIIWTKREEVCAWWWSMWTWLSLPIPFLSTVIITTFHSNTIIITHLFSSLTITLTFIPVVIPSSESHHNEDHITHNLSSEPLAHIHTHPESMHAYTYTLQPKSSTPCTFITPQWCPITRQSKTFPSWSITKAFPFRAERESEKKREKECLCVSEKNGWE